MQTKTKVINSSWYILKTKSNCEKKVHESILRQGFTSYLPTYTSLRIWSDRKKKIETPLLPSYVFVNCDSKDVVVAAKTIGVAYIMRELNSYAIVKDYEIENLRIYLSGNLESIEVDLEDFQIGEWVRVVQGPFAGLIGTATQHQSDYRVRIEISNIGTHFTINVPKSHVEKTSMNH